MNPPEDTTHADDSPALFTAESDVYAFSMTVIEIFTGMIPFNQKKNDSSVIFTVLDGGRPEVPPFLNDQESLRVLVQDCWQQMPGKRPTSRAVNDRLRTSMPEETEASGENNTSKGWFGSWI